MGTNQANTNTQAALSFLVGWSGWILRRMIETVTDDPCPILPEDQVAILKFRNLLTSTICDRYLKRSQNLLEFGDLYGFVKLGTIEMIERYGEGPINFEDLKTLQTLAERQFPVFLRVVNVLYTPNGWSQCEFIDRWIDKTVEVADRRLKESWHVRGFDQSAKFVAETPELYSEIVRGLMDRQVFKKTFANIFETVFDLDNLKKVMLGDGMADLLERDKMSGYRDHADFSDGLMNRRVENDLREMISEFKPRAEAWLKTELERVYGKES